MKISKLLLSLIIGALLSTAVFAQEPSQTPATDAPAKTEVKAPKHTPKTAKPKKHAKSGKLGYLQSGGKHKHHKKQGN